MPIAAKPSAYTVNTAHVHCPDHLWLMDEGSGTTLTDKGKTGGYNLTFSATTGAGPDWTTDGTHGPVLDFVAANEDKLTKTGITGLNGTQTIGVIVNAALGTAQRIIAGLTDPSQADRYCELVYQGDEDLECVVRFDDTATNNTSTQALTHGSWDFVAIRMSDTAFDWSLNGSAWATGSHSHTGMIAAFTAFALGYHNTTIPGNFWDESMCAAMWWHGSKADAEIATIAANPWLYLDIGTLKVKVLAPAAAASASSIEGVVLNAARDTVIGEFTAQAFEAALEGGEAVLKIAVADITPDGSTLTTSDAPLVVAYNTAYSTDLAAATVIEE